MRDHVVAEFCLAFVCLAYLVETPEGGDFDCLREDHTFKMEVDFHLSLCCFITSLNVDVASLPQRNQVLFT